MKNLTFVSTIRKPRYYLAYGSNLNLTQMQYRCAGAKPCGTMLLPGFRLVFRRVADIEQTGKVTDSVPVGIYTITPADEKALDRYEGYNVYGTGLYRKEYLQAKTNSGTPIELMYYTMNANYYERPNDSYYRTIAQGYMDFDFDSGVLESADNHARKHGRTPVVYKAPAPKVTYHTPAPAPKKTYVPASTEQFDSTVDEISAEVQRRLESNFDSWYETRYQKEEESDTDEVSRNLRNRLAL